MVERAGYLRLLRNRLRSFPAVAILGPRQAGKSTLAREFARTARTRKRVVTFDLERPSDLNRLMAAPEEELEAAQAAPGLICIDEIQRAPHLFALLRPLLDDRRRRARYLLLGSASPSLVTGVSESLAGRIGFLDLAPLAASEVKTAEGPGRTRHWLRGGYPPSLLARSERSSREWREAYVRAFLERDVPALGFQLPPIRLRRFWTMLAHVHGGVLNQSELAASLGVSVPTISRYLDLLEGTFMIRRLAPWWENLGKRLTRTPKLYFRDSGLLHTLLGVENLEGLRSHPKAGASWEGWVIEQIATGLRLSGESIETYFWRTHGGAEVDLIVRARGRSVPVEIKLGAEPRATRGLLQCMEDLNARRGFVVHGGRHAYSLGNRVRAVPASLVGDPAALVSTLLGA